MKNGSFTRIIASILVCLTAAGVSSAAESPIRPDLEEVMKNSADGEMIEIMISLTTIDMDTLKAELLERGFDRDIYEDLDSMRAHLYPPAIAELKVDPDYQNMFQFIEPEDYESLNSAQRYVVGTRIVDEVDLYHKAKIGVYREHYDSARDSLLEKYGDEGYKEINRYGIVGMVRVKATAETITQLAGDEAVSRINLYLDYVFEGEQIAGDADGSGRFNLTDVSFTLKFLAGFDYVVEEAIERGVEQLDYNGDGKVNLTDCADMLKKLAGHE